MLTGVVRVELPGKRFEGNIWLGQRSPMGPHTKQGPALIAITL